MRQILLNLLSNAVKFTPAEGSVTLGVARNSGDGINISVVDTGIGMTETEAAKALELYGQVETDLTKKTRAPASACRWSSRWPSCTAARCR